MKAGLKFFPALLVAVALAALASACNQRKAQAGFTPTGNFDIHIQLSTNVITVGESVEATIEVYHPPEGLVTVPELDRRPQIVVRSRASSSEGYDEERAITRINYSLTSYRVGIHPLSTGLVRCAVSGAETLERPFPDMNLVVNSVLSNETEAVREMRALREPASPFPWMIVAILGVIALAIALAIIIAQLVKKPAPPKPPPPAPPAHETAFTALNRLKASGMIEDRDFDPFYVAVSGILREYIEQRYKLHAPEMTTEEFIQAASQSHELNAEHHTLVRQFLEECDMVKFAKLEPDQEAMVRVWESAECFVKETIPGHNPYGPNSGDVA